MKVVKLPSGQYRTRIMINGKTHSVTRATISDVKNEAIRLKAEHINGGNIYVNPKKTTLREACERYISDRSAILSPSTIRGYKLIMSARFKEQMDLPLSDKINWQKVINKEAEKVSPKTVINSWGFIKTVLRSLNMRVPDVSVPQEEVKDQPWLTYDEMLILIDAVRDTWIELPVLLALNGLRRSEIFALEKKNFDIANKIIHVRGARVSAIKGYEKKSTNKNSTSTRDVPILFDRICEIAPKLPETDIFADMSENKLYQKINRVCVENGLPEVGVHGCRRSFASWCARNKIPEDVCMKWGGWKDMYVMRAIYTKYSEKDMSSYAEAMRIK